MQCRVVFGNGCSKVARELLGAFHPCADVIGGMIFVLIEVNVLVPNAQDD